MDELRSRRVAEAMREELSELVRFEVDDPRVQGVEVADVIVSPDLRRADVLVVLTGSAGEQEAALEGLAAARHYLRRNLMQRMAPFPAGGGASSGRAAEAPAAAAAARASARIAGFGGKKLRTFIDPAGARVVG